jgi:hypothetical protein
MAIIIPSRTVAPQTVSQPTQAAQVDETAPIVNALDIVGRTTQSLAETGIKGEILDAKEQERLDALAIKKQEDADKADATEAVTLSKGAINQQMIAYKSRKKRTASGVTLEYDAFAKELYEKTLEGLPNERAKALYVEDMLAVNINSRNSVLEHENAEQTASFISAATSSANISVESGIANFDNPNTHLIEEDNIQEQAISMQELNGWSPEERQEWESERLSAMYEGIVRQWAITDAETARLSFDTNKEKIDPTKYDELEKVLTTNKSVQDGGALANEAMLQGETEGERLEWLTKNASTDEATNKEARAQVRLQSADQRDQQKRDAIKSDDNILADIQALKDSGGTKAQAMNLIIGASSAKEQLSLRKTIDGLFKPVDALPPDNTTDDYATHLTTVYQDIEAGQYTSLSQLRRSTLGRLTEADQTEVENHFQQGGLLGGLSESSIEKAFKLYAGYNATDIPVTYQNARRIIVANVRALPPGRTKVTATEIDKWMSDAVRGQADSGLIPTKESIGVTDQLTDAQRENVISLMEKGNNDLIAAGKTPYPINAETIARASANVYPRVKEAPPVVEPVIIAPQPALGAEQPLTATEISERGTAAGVEIPTETAQELEREQFGKGGIKGLIERSTGGTTAALTLGEAIPDEVDTFEEFLPIIKKQLEDEGLEEGDVSQEKLDKFYRDEFQKFIRNK